jgi:HD-like signal output (HDOD) protein
MTTDNSPFQLEKLLGRAQLPALPQSAIRLLELLQDPDNGPHEFAVPIESDPGLTGQVLRFVNSSYFGFANEISSIKLAISMVGIRTIKNFAMWSAVFSLMPNPKCGPFDLKSLWQDSLRRALFSRIFGKILGLSNAEDLFAAALLQDMAVPLLAKELPTEYESLLESRMSGKVRLSDLEKERFGWSHADASALMARNWSLPDQFVSLIENHTDLAGALEHGDAGTRAVSLSAMLPTARDPSWNERAAFLEAFARLAPADAPPVAEVFASVDTAFGEFAPILKLAIPAAALVDILATEDAEVEDAAV